MHPAVAQGQASMRGHTQGTSQFPIVKGCQWPITSALDTALSACGGALCALLQTRVERPMHGQVGDGLLAATGAALNSAAPPDGVGCRTLLWAGARRREHHSGQVHTCCWRRSGSACNRRSGRTFRRSRRTQAVLQFCCYLFCEQWALEKALYQRPLLPLGRFPGHNSGLRRCSESP